ncbi:MAG: HD domain-containing protein [Spirochaetes bacterium]|jgi:nicotinate-nucleotide adenylyltransferase|nr:HD domain-containing protein [Spirochaetota bacterium]
MQIRERVSAELSAKRRRHVEGVSSVAVQIADRVGLDPRRVALAAWTHDLCREWERSALCSCVDTEAFPLTETERENPVLCHGPAAATQLRSAYHIRDPEVLQAVRWHTTGNAGLCDLAKVIYVADYLEPNRSYTDEAFRRSALDENLERMVKQVLDHTVSRGLAMAPETRAMYEEVSAHVN